MSAPPVMRNGVPLPFDGSVDICCLRSSRDGVIVYIFCEYVEYNPHGCAPSRSTRSRHPHPKLGRVTRRLQAATVLLKFFTLPYTFSSSLTRVSGRELGAGSNLVFDIDAFDCR
ncbi:hypothetical protein RRG08_040126 [Elysia crispata]|uniref:Uncharacterized protein n=1 Tax=Elysia crispata TaxID=231223 RepID=A0AAE1CNF1_9GAST|nr:hypothetical protein RRG08_040126 [Elysia crispata]